MTASTLLLDDCHMSEEVANEDLDRVHECQGSVSNYLEKFPEDCQEAKLIHWIEVRGPNVPEADADGYGPDISSIWHLIRSVHAESEDLTKLEKAFERQQEQIEKVKSMQIKKHGSNHPKMAELDQWANTKLETATKNMADLKHTLQTSQCSLSDRVQKLLKQLLKQHQGADDIDPECQALMDELEGMFTDLSIAGGDDRDHAMGDADPGTLDATKLALASVQALPDGPPKSALMAVLEAAVVAQQVGMLHNNRCFQTLSVPFPFQFAGSHIGKWQC